MSGLTGEGGNNYENRIGVELNLLSFVDHFPCLESVDKRGIESQFLHHTLEWYGDDQIRAFTYVQ